MIEWLEDIVSLCGQRCSIIDIGQSYEGRKLQVVKVRAMTSLLLYPTTNTVNNTLAAPAADDDDNDDVCDDLRFNVISPNSFSHCCQHNDVCDHRMICCITGNCFRQFDILFRPVTCYIVGRILQFTCCCKHVC